MSFTTIECRQIAYGTAAEWVAVNPILAKGEEGYETDTKKRKVGDGITRYTSLTYEIHTSGNGGAAFSVGALTASSAVTTGITGYNSAGVHCFMGADGNNGLLQARNGNTFIPMLIDGSYVSLCSQAGNVLIGTATASTGAKLEVAGSISSIGNQFMSSSCVAGDSNNRLGFSYTGAPTTDVRAAIDFGVEGGGEGYLQFMAGGVSGSGLAEYARVSRTGLAVTGGISATDGIKTADGTYDVKKLILTGTTAATEGGSTNVAHGLNAALIKSITALVFYSSGAGVTPHSPVAGYKYTVSFSTSNVTIDLDTTSSENILSKAFSVVIEYT